jgi:hypothetical protein
MLLFGLYKKVKLPAISQHGTLSINSKQPCKSATDTITALGCFETVAEIERNVKLLEKARYFALFGQISEFVSTSSEVRKLYNS